MINTIIGLLVVLAIIGFTTYFIKGGGDDNEPKV